LLARREKTIEESDDQNVKVIYPAFALLCGAMLGLLSGLTGVGGGIFLSPLLLFMKWTDVRQTAAISAMFILVNSVAGLGANLSQTSIAALPSPIIFSFFASASVLGGHLGATFGVNRKQSTLLLRRLLAIVLLIAALKMLFG
jgi:uncharacterized membrane protein YfcA